MSVEAENYRIKCPVGGGVVVHLNKAPGERGSADKGAFGTVI